MCISTERQVTHMKKGLTELVFILDRSIMDCIPAKTWLVDEGPGMEVLFCQILNQKVDKLLIAYCQ